MLAQATPTAARDESVDSAPPSPEPSRANKGRLKVAVERIDYQAGAVTGKGALVWNEKVSGKRPLLLVMPNWLGVTENAIRRAHKMAGDKYVAFVGCMYGEGKTDRKSTRLNSSHIPLSRMPS